MAAELREVLIYYKGHDGKQWCEHINMAANLTDQEIFEYFKIGKVFNVGCGPFDYMAKVEHLEITK